MTGDEMGSFARRVGDSDGMKVAERISAVLFLPALALVTALFMAKLGAMSAQLSENSEIIRSQEITGTLYRERVDKLQAVQATLRELTYGLREDVQEHDYRINTLEDYRRMKLGESRPGQ